MEAQSTHPAAEATSSSDRLVFWQFVVAVLQLAVGIVAVIVTW